MEDASHSIKLPFTYYTFSNVPEDDASKINQHLWEQEQSNNDEEEDDLSWMLNIQEVNCFTVETCIRMLFRSNKSTDQIYKLILADRSLQYEKPKSFLEYPILTEENGSVWKEDIFKICSHLVHEYCAKIHHQQQAPSSTNQVLTVMNEMNQFLLKDSLSAKEKIQFEILEDLICNKLYGGVLFHWYCLDENFWGHVYPFLQHQCKGILSGWLVPRWIRNKKQKQVQQLLKPYFAHNLSEDRMLQLFTFLEETLQCIASHLQFRMKQSTNNGNSFLFDDAKPCILDIYLYSFLSSLLLSHFSDTRLLTLTRKFCPTLSQYCSNITQIYFPEEEDWIQNLSSISRTAQRKDAETKFNRVIQNIIKENEDKAKSKYWNRIFLYSALGALAIPVTQILLREWIRELAETEEIEE